MPDSRRGRELTRRSFLAAAASSLGGSLAYARGRAQASRVRWVERREWFAEGVASGDPDSHSVLLWRRVSATGRDAVPLTVEVAEDAGFTRVVASSPARASAAADYTCRVLVSGLQPARTYWYRFFDQAGTRQPRRADADGARYRQRRDGVRVRVHPSAARAKFGPDGAPIRYRVVHRAPLWRAGARPQLEQRVLEGDPELAL